MAWQGTASPGAVPVPHFQDSPHRRSRRSGSVQASSPDHVGPELADTFCSRDSRDEPINWWPLRDCELAGNTGPIRI